VVNKFDLDLLPIAIALYDESSAAQLVRPIAVPKMTYASLEGDH
jgi:hypothetical protein